MRASMWTLCFVLATFLQTPEVVGQKAAHSVTRAVADVQDTGTATQTPPVKQAEPAKKDAKAAPEKEDQEPAKTDEETPPPARKPIRLPHSLLTLETGYMDWALGGNEHKFRQYGTPPRGFFVRELTLSPRTSSRDYGFLTLRGPGEIDYRNDAAVALNYGRTMFEGTDLHNEFFDTTPVVIPSSGRDVREVSLRQHITRDASLSYHYRMLNEDRYFDVPSTPLRQRTRYWDTIGSARLGNGLLNIAYTDWRYFDRTGTLLDTTVNGWRFGYLWEPSHWVGLEANYANLQVKQTGVATGHLDSASIAGDVAVGPTTDVGVTLRRDRLNVPLTQTAYAREQRSGTLRLGQRWKGWSVQMSGQVRDVERVRADQTFVDVPQWVTFDGRLYGKPLPNVRLTVRGYTQSVSNLPPMVTDDTRSLYWNCRQFAQLKLEHGKQELNSYFVWTYRNWDNTERASNLNFNSFVVGSTWQMTSALTLFAEYTKETWDGRNEINTFPSYQNFLPDSHVLAAGLNVLITPRAFLSVNMTHYATANDNPLLLRDGNTNGIFFTINTRYQLPSGTELGLVIAPWAYHDDVIHTMDYNSTMVMLTGKARF